MVINATVGIISTLVQADRVREKQDTIMAMKELEVEYYYLLPLPLPLLLRQI